MSLKDNCKIISLPHHEDSRGVLSVMEGNKDIPFEIKRVFWIYDIPENTSRGEHAHQSCWEVVFAINGALKIDVTDGKETLSVTLDSPHTGIVIPAGIWCKLHHFAPNTICVVAASQSYDSKGYINDYNDYLKLSK